MRACIVTPSFPVAGAQGRGGSGTYSEVLAQAWLQLSAEVHVVVYREDTETTPGEPQIPVTLHRLQLHPVPYLSGLLPGLVESWQIAGFLRQLDNRYRFDIVEGMNDEGHLYFAAGHFKHRFWLRLLSSLRQHILNKNLRLTWRRRFAIWLDARTARRSVNLVTQSEFHAREMGAEYGLKPADIHIVPLAVEQPEPAGDRAALGSVAPVVTFIGSQDRRKGIDLFLEAAVLVSQQQPHATFLVVGRDGGDSGVVSWQNWFASRHPQMVSQGRVAFPGFVPDEEMTRTVWSCTTCAVIPSRYESFGLIAAEAFARGIPVVAARGGALPEVVQDGGILVPADDPSALAHALDELLRNPARQADLVARGKLVYEREYTIERFAERLLMLYAL